MGKKKSQNVDQAVWLRLVSDGSPLPRPQAFLFNDFLTLVTEWFRYLQSQDETLSLRKLASKCQISPGYLHNLLNGKRGITRDTLNKFYPVLQMSPEEFEYLENLRVIHNKEASELQTEAFSKILKIKASHSSNPEETESYEFYKSWLKIVIREMVRLKGFKLKSSWIKKCLTFKQSPKEISDAVDFLSKNKYVQKQEDGTYEQAVKNISCKGPVFKIANSVSHKAFLDLAKESIEHVPSEKRHIRGRIFAIKKDAFPEVKAVIEKAMKELEEIEDRAGKDAEEIIYVSSSAFPVAELPGEEDE